MPLIATVQVDSEAHPFLVSVRTREPDYARYQYKMAEACKMLGLPNTIRIFSSDADDQKTGIFARSEGEIVHHEFEIEAAYYRSDSPETVVLWRGFSMPAAELFLAIHKAQHLHRHSFYFQIRDPRLEDASSLLRGNAPKLIQPHEVWP
jgi:hypothetical protein